MAKDKVELFLKKHQLVEIEQINDDGELRDIASEVFNE
jgi:hypothetical protein